MLIYFLIVFGLVILAELVKGLSANGTPPVLQKFAWQMDLARLMWTQIGSIRAVGGALLVVLAVLLAAEERLIPFLAAVPLATVWGGIYWLFNRFWVGRYKFPAISVKRFVTAQENSVDPEIQVIGVDHGGVQKAYPVNMIFFHHQIPDNIAGQPIWVTYCGLCRSGRVYDLMFDGNPLTFSLVGAITFNAVFRDDQTGSWWRQETGEAAKGPLAGRVLDDFPFVQMSLKNWLAKHPESQVLQYDQAFSKRYNFINKLLNYEASLPGWHMQKTPPMVTGVSIEGAARAYDWKQLQKRKLVHDRLAEIPLLLIAEPDGDSALVYDRRIQGKDLEFDMTDDGLRDTETGSSWTYWGKCMEGPLKGEQLTQVQSYQQFLRAWISFHEGSTFYNF